MAIQLTDENFESTIKKDQLTVVDFWAPWCGPCKILGPVIEELSEQYKETATIAKVNVDENSAISSNYGIRNIPTILFFKNGEVVDKLVGFGGKPALENKIKSLI